MINFARAVCIAAMLALPLTAHAAELPQQLSPNAPFPRIHTQAPTFEAIAPGVEYGDYELTTDAGPLSIHVIAVEPHHDDVHIDSVLANDHLTSQGETVTSMARRTGAVAGINGDYFDIASTNQPTNIVIHAGALVRTPRKRYALVIRSDGTPRIAELQFSGQAQIGSRTVALQAVNELPPPNSGVSLITPEFGPVAPMENLTLVGLQPNGTAPFTQYRVTGVADNLARQPAGFYLAIGLSAYGSTGVPNTGDIVSVSGDLSPGGLSTLGSAIGGGPLLLNNGTFVIDPDGPNGAEFLLRIPSSGAAIAPDGTLFLIEVDGRQPLWSVGLFRPEFAALMRAFGATTGMAFDGGGSSELAVRTLGDTEAQVVNAPSDGVERKVGDGLFVYSTAPVGAPSQVIAQPAVVRALPGASVDLRLAALDNAQHVVTPPQPISVSVRPASLGTFANGAFLAARAGEGALVLRSGALSTELPIHVTASPARLAIDPPNPNVAQNGRIKLHVRAYDLNGYTIAVPQQLPWRATLGTIDTDGVYSALTRNTTVMVKAGDLIASTVVTVGTHDAPLPFAFAAHFQTIPRGGPGSLTPGAGCGECTQLNFSIGPGERAAYAIAELPLPSGTIGLAFDVLDDGNGAHLRVALRNAINEQVLVSAGALDRSGWRHVVVRFPPTLAQPARLIGIYAIGRSATETHHGSIVLRNVRAVIAGSE